MRRLKTTKEKTFFTFQLLRMKIPDVAPTKIT